MSKFEDNLWREIVRTRGTELAKEDGPIGRRSALRVPLLAGGGVGVAGTATALVLILGAAGSSPAFAVTPHSDGTVSVVIRRVQGIDGANRRLAQLGIRARAVRVSASCSGQSSHSLSPSNWTSVVAARRGDWVGAAAKANAKIRPDRIPARSTLVIPTVAAGKVVRLVHGGAVRGTVVPSCLPPVVLAQLRGGRPMIQVLCPAPGPPTPGATTATTTGGATDTRTAGGGAGTTTATATETTTAATATATATQTTAPDTATATATQTTAAATTTAGPQGTTGARQAPTNSSAPHWLRAHGPATIACVRARAAAHRAVRRGAQPLQHERPSGPREECLARAGAVGSAVVAPP